MIFRYPWDLTKDIAQGGYSMNSLGLKVPKFLNLDDAAQKKIIEDIFNSEIVDDEKQATIESMIFLKEFQKKLKENPNITAKQIKHLFEAYAEKIKKILLTH